MSRFVEKRDNYLGFLGYIDCFLLMREIRNLCTFFLCKLNWRKINLEEWMLVFMKELLLNFFEKIY